MKLTVGIFDFLLREKLGLYSENRVDPERMMGKILLYTGETDTEDGVYLSTKPVADSEQVLVISSERQSTWCIVVPEESVYSTISSILSLYQDYLLWAHRCTMTALAEHDLQDFMATAGPYLNMRWAMIDPAYLHIASYPPNNFMNIESFYPNQAMPLDAMDNLYSSDPDFDNTYETTGLCAYPQFQMEDAELYYCNVFQASLYLGRLLIGIPKTSICEEMLSLVRMLCELATECYHYQYRHSAREENRNVLPLVRRLFAGEIPPEDELEGAFSPISWNTDDRFEIIRLVSNGYYHSEETLKYYAVQIENRFSGVIALARNDGISCIHNLTQSGSQNHRQQMALFLRENLFKAGISNDYVGIEKSGRYHQQAEDAMELGQRYAPSLWRYDFCDYVTQYITEQCLSHYESMDLCPKSLRTLIRYDQEHPDSCLTETLYQYYANNFSIQEASAKLYIHRTTFFYRMNKIKKMVHLHPENPKEVALILLILTEMKEKNEPF